MTMKTPMELDHYGILSRFRLSTPPVSCAPYGRGHINRTFLVRCANGAEYMLQRINTDVFRTPDALQRNIRLVTEHLRTKSPDPRSVLYLVPTIDGGTYVNVHGECWRVYTFVANSVCLQRADTPALFEESARAFARFFNSLSDFPAEELAETIPHFHDSPARFAALKDAIERDPLGRAKDVRREIDFALAREPLAHAYDAAKAAGELPLRVTHNDTKINNVLFDEVTMRGLCVIDLDTVMPGLIMNDFGDAIRFGASTGEEDERDLSKIALDLTLYEAYARGYLAECGNAMTPAEKELLPTSAMLMTYECGTRFLADHLVGDTYFRIARPGHNLDRARTQFALVADMERKWDEMRRITAAAAL